MHKWFDTFWEVLAAYLGMLMLAALLFSYFEHVHFWDAFWWASVTSTTTGYGDMYPKTIPGQVVAWFLMHISIFFVLPLIISHVCSALIKNQHEFSHEEQEEIKILLKAINDKVDARW